MKIRIAILAAWASTLTLAQADVARANSVTAPAPKSPVRIADAGPKPMIVAGGFKISENESPTPQNRVKAPVKGNGSVSGGSPNPKNTARSGQPAGGLFNTLSLGVEVDGRRKTTSEGGVSSNPKNTAKPARPSGQPDGGLFGGSSAGMEFRR